MAGNWAVTDRTFAKNGTDALSENLLVSYLWEGLGYLQCLYRRRFRRPCVHCFGVRFAGTLRPFGTPARFAVDRPPFLMDLDVNPASSTCAAVNIRAIAFVMCLALMRSRLLLKRVPPYTIGKSGPHLSHGVVRMATSFYFWQSV